MLLNLKNNYFTERYYSFFYNTRETYYNRFSDFVDVEDLIKHAQKNIDCFIQTSKEIKLFNLSFDILPQNLLKIFGKPHFYKRIRTNPTINTKTYFYKKPFFKNEAILQFAFVNDILSYCIVTFISQNNMTDDIFLKIISEKYSLP